MLLTLPIGLTGSYLDDDDDDDENSVSINKLKNKYKADKGGKSGAQKAPIYSSDRYIRWSFYLSFADLVSFAALIC